MRSPLLPAALAQRDGTQPTCCPAGPSDRQPKEPQEKANRDTKRAGCKDHSQRARCAQEIKGSYRERNKNRGLRRALPGKKASRNEGQNPSRGSLR